MLRRTFHPVRSHVLADQVQSPSSSAYSRHPEYRLLHRVPVTLVILRLAPVFFAARPRPNRDGQCHVNLVCHYFSQASLSRACGLHVELRLLHGGSSDCLDVTVSSGATPYGNAMFIDLDPGTTAANMRVNVGTDKN